LTTQPKESRPRAQLLRLQRATYARLVEDLRKHRARESRELRLYRKRYEHDIATFRRISSKAELVSRVMRASIVFCGDYHTLRQAQRTAIKILREIVGRRESIQLGLELIPKSAERTANNFVRKRIDEATFLHLIDYRHRWGFPWDHYRPLFMFAREHNLRLVGLNADDGDASSLEDRDALAAQVIVENTLRDPKTLLFCLYGDLHLARPHIPRMVHERLKRLKAPRETVTVLQNAEPIFWSLADQGLENSVDVVELFENTFCVLGAAPWIKWQSYWSWLEDHTDLLSLPDTAENSEEEDFEQPDYYHQVLELAQRICDFLKLRPRELEHFSVYTAQDLRVIDELERYCEACERRDVPITSLIRAEIVENGSCYFPEQSVLYLSDLSENRAGEKAAQLASAKLDPEFSVFPLGASWQEVFYRLLLWEAVAFLGSKIINPKRKCPKYSDFERRHVGRSSKKLRPREKEDQALADAILQHRALERQPIRQGLRRGVPSLLRDLRPGLFFRVASSLGQILGEGLYNLMVADKIGLDLLQELFHPVGKEPDGAQRKYWRMAQTLQRLPEDRSSKDDRF
jgi:hypothetical protein